MYEDLEAELHDVFWQVDGCGEQEINSIADLIRAKPGCVLELGCGSGRIMTSLIESGFAVDGLELSETMLDLCRQRLHENAMNAELHHGDMAEFDLDQKDYDWIIVPAFSLQMLDGQASFRSCLEAIRGHLKATGRLYFSVFLPWAELLGDLEPGVWYDDAQAENASTGELATLQTKFQLKLKEQSLLRQHKYQVFGKNGELQREQKTEMSLHFYFLKELRLMLRQAGFRIVESWPDFERGEDADSVEYPACLSVVAMKKL